MTTETSSSLMPKTTKSVNASYPLVVQSLNDCDGGPPCAYFSKGHHSAFAFADAVKAIYDVEIDPHKVDYVWRRWALISWDGDWQRCLHPAQQGTRGTFPVTIIEW